MSEPDMLPILRAFVEAHRELHPVTGKREPIYYMRHLGGSTVSHHALGEDGPNVDEATIDEMYSAGLVSLDYLEHGFKITTTSEGRELIEAVDRVERDEPVADVGPVLAAIAAQAKATNKLGWPAVRPAVAAIRSYWEAGGFSRHGVQLAALMQALPAEHRPLFAVTIRQLTESDYLRETTKLACFDGTLPAEVAMTESAHRVLDGWPGAAPDELVENLLAVLLEELSTETDPVRKRGLKRLVETIREVGVATAGDVLGRALMGGTGD